MPDFQALAFKRTFKCRYLLTSTQILEGRQHVSCQPVRLLVATHKAVCMITAHSEHLVPMTMRSPSNCATVLHAVLHIIHSMALIGWVKWVSPLMKPASFQTQTCINYCARRRPLLEVWLGESLVLIRDQEAPRRRLSSLTRSVLPQVSFRSYRSLFAPSLVFCDLLSSRCLVSNSPTHSL